MKEVEFIWKNGQLLPWQEAQTHVLTHALHYGSAVFEGIRCYATKKGPTIFKLEEHIERFFYSAKQLGMHLSLSPEDLCQAVRDTVAKNNMQAGYIRPLAYYGYGEMKILPSPQAVVDVIIACWPWGAYLPAECVDVAISPYIRIHPQSTVADAKISGHYINSILSGLALRNTHYHEALLLDFNGFVAEGCTSNVFMVQSEKIITPPKGTILMGITRQTVLDIAQFLKIPVEEKYFTPQEMYQADEAFFSGTAVEITAIRSLDDRIIGKGCIGPVTEKIKTCFQHIVHGEEWTFTQAPCVSSAEHCGV